MLEKLPEAVGEALEGVRAGLTATVFHSVDLRQGMGALTVASLAFADHTPLPARYTADAPGGHGISPPLHWHGVPAAATEVVLIVEDADSPTPQPLVLALAHGLPPCSGGAPGAGVDAGADAGAGADPAPLRTEGQASTGQGALAEGALGGTGDGELRVAMGRNSLLQTRWLPPDPPPGHGLHRYVFQVFALGPGTPLPEVPGREALCQALVERGMASGCLIGTCERSSGPITERSSASLGLNPGLAVG